MILRFLLLFVVCVSVAPADALVAGDMTTLAIIVTFQDAPTVPYAISPGIVQSGLAETNSFYWEASYGTTWMSSALAGPYVVPITTSAATESEIKAQALRAAIAAGFDVTTPRFIVYAFPGVADTPTGTVVAPVPMPIGGHSMGRDIYIATSFTPLLLAHEMGHTFGLLHSHAADQWWGVYRDQGNPYDTMGLYGVHPRHYNAFQKERLGWLDDAATHRLATVVGDGTFFLAPYETMGTGTPKALKIPLYYRKAVIGAYYLEYRQPIGHDTGFAGNVYQGVLITDGTNSLRDMTPNASLTEPFMSNPALTPGRTYCDAVQNVSITTVSADASGAWVEVDLASRCRVTGVQ